ncbi:MAG TPA: hypothetical protein VK828_10125 [Terriglobales bacterium]|jgi:hypothetical protein|nr:hypothetical protein [Terriglobales bacterium]
MGAQNARRVAAIILPATVMPSLWSAAAQKTPDNTAFKNCPGLHAGIRAQIVPPYTETPSVMLSFLLLNDSDAALDVDAGSWRLFVDGHELNGLDTQQVFGNGPMPVGGYRILKPGETYEFSKALSISQYFLPNGEHKVSWKGTAFQSPTITVTITLASH